jgi:hypothetical protein
MTPALPGTEPSELNKVLLSIGELKLGWLMILKTSVRNSRFNRSVIFVSLIKEKSKSTAPGPLISLRLPVPSRFEHVPDTTVPPGVKGKLRVLDPEASDGMRAKIQATMQGTEVLDVSHFPETHFRSTGVEPNGADHWIVHGNLNLHGQTHPISFEVAFKDGLYQGAAALNQTGFGITPAKVAGGTVKVKDEVEIAFSIALQN